MAPKALLELVHPPTDLDYVEQFQALARVNLEIRKNGATCDRLLRKSILEMDLGNPAAALEAAQDAVITSPGHAEAHYQTALSHVLMAFVKAGVHPLSPGHVLPEEDVGTLLERAQEDFEEAVRLNGEDEEAAQDLEAVTEFLAAHDDEAAMVRELREKSLC